MTIDEFGDDYLRASEAHVGELSKSGESIAFAAIYDRHIRHLYAIAHRCLQNSTDSEEAVALAFFELWKKRQDIVLVDGSVGPWLRRTLTFVCANIARSRQREWRFLQRLAAVEEALAGHELPDPVDSCALAAALGFAFAALQPCDQDVARLALIDELPLAAVATQLNVPIGTVKSRLHRARRALQKSMSATPTSAMT